MSVASRKRALRTEMRTAISALERATHRALSVRVVSHLADLPWLRGGARVAFYAALPDEVSTDDLLIARWQRGAPVFLPRMRPDGFLDFVAVRGKADLHAVRRGIREPLPELPASDLSQLEAVVLPGLAFDRLGVRLGRGGGFYDRTFCGAPRADRATRPRMVGIAFELQIVDALPCVSHDLRVDLLVTEHGPSDPR